MTDERVSTRWAQLEADRDGWIPRPGDVVAGRYEVERNIGGGGMGVVVAARHRQLDDRVAVKFLHPRLAIDTANVERFVREARAASRIKTEHVIRVHDIGTTEDGLPFIVMELLEGIDLAHLVARGPVPIELAVDCTLQAAEALAEAHAVGIVHRDIKPSNLWLSHRKDGTPLVKVLDFGISKLTTTEGDTKLTETQAVFGSPSYMSPEQIRSAKRVDHRTDIWALGIVLYELLTTELPFDADNVPGVLAAVMADEPRPIRPLRPDVPAEVEAILLACLAKDPARRATLVELTAALRPFASPTGMISVDRVNRIERSTAPVVPPPAGSSSVPSFAVTETAPDTIQVSRPASSITRVAVGIGIGVLVGLGVVAAKVWRAPEQRAPVSPGTATATSAVAETSSTPPPALAPTPSASVSTAPAPATPVTSASAVPAPHGGRPRGPGARPHPTNGSPPSPAGSSPSIPISEDRR